MRFIIIIFITVVFFVPSLVGQDKQLYQKTYSERFDISFNPHYPSSSIPNYFIDEIAKSIPKIRMYVKVNYQYNLDCKVEKKGSKYGLFLKIQDITRGGNYKYKDFDFSRLIAPSALTHTLKVYDESSNKNYLQKVTISFLEQDSIWVNIKQLNGVITYRVRIEPLSVKPEYLPEQKIAFQAAIQNIDSYYDDALKIDALKKRLVSLQFDEVEVVGIRNVDLKYIEKDLQKIQPKNYSESLNLDSYDPIRLLQKYDSLSQMIADTRNRMDKKLGNLDQVYYTQAMDLTKNEDYKLARSYFQKSISINPYYFPSAYQLSLLDYNSNEYLDCIKRTQHILNDLKPDNKVKQQTIDLTYRCYDSIMMITANLNSEENYTQSINILSVTKNVCDSTQFIECDDRVNTLLSQATFGLYSSYLSIAEASLAKGRLDMCQDYMKMALDFKNKNKDKIISSNKKEGLIIEKLITELVNQSEVSNNIGNHEEAKSLLTQAKTLCDEFPNNGCNSIINKNEAIVHQNEYNALISKSIYYSNHHQAQKSKEYISLANTYQSLHSDYISTSIGTDTLMGNISYKMYLDYIINGKRELDNRQYQEAYAEFYQANKLEKQFQFSKDENLLKYTQNSVKPVILNLIKQGQLKAWGKYYEEASQLLDSSQLLTKQWMLSEDVEIIKATNQLGNDLGKKVCDDKVKEYYSLLRKANASKRFNDYYQASLQWNKTVDLARSNPLCKMDMNFPMQELMKYAIAISYQGEIKVGDSLLPQEPKKAFDHFLRANNILKGNHEALSNIKTQDLFEILYRRNTFELNILGIEYYNASDAPEKSYRLLINALASNQTFSIEILETTASKLAKFDRTNQPNASFKELAEMRFGKNEELKQLKKLYIKSF